MVCTRSEDLPTHAQGITLQCGVSFSQPQAGGMKSETNVQHGCGMQLYVCENVSQVPFSSYAYAYTRCFVCLFACLFVLSVAWALGDPHINTLDGRVYTFNGWGEYMLANVTVLGSFQGRTSLVPGSSATQFSAFAFGNMSARVEVSVIQSK